MFRSISLLLRKFQSKKAEKKTVKNFIEWKNQQAVLPGYEKKEKTLLIIRTDDIGDYILFRNDLASYKNSAHWKDFKITLLGNIVWKPLFEELDSKTVDSIYWMDKKSYFESADYRLDLWLELRKQGFEEVVCPARTRSLLLDDLCATATGSLRLSGAKNNSRHYSWNNLSDSFYSSLFQSQDDFLHELSFNRQFAEWCCGNSSPVFYPPKNNPEEKYVLCFIGSSTKSKTWPVKNWIEFISLFTERNHYKIIISGGKNDMPSASEIFSNCKTSKNNIENLTGKTSLIQMLYYVNNASAVISNDTMAVHLAAACKTPLLIIANGNNYYRFTDYKTTGLNNILTIYPKVFLKLRDKKNIDELQYYTAVTADIASVKGSQVAQAITALLNADKNE